MNNLFKAYSIVLGYSLIFIIPALMLIFEFDLNSLWILVIVIPVIVSAWYTNKKLRLH